MEYGTDGRLHVKFRAGYSIVAPVVVNRGIAGVLLSLAIQILGQQIFEYGVYGRPVYQCKLYCSTDIFDAKRRGCMVKKGVWKWVSAE